jgi:chromosome segregation ATPase
MKMVNGTTAITKQIEARLAQLEGDLKEAEWDQQAKSRAESDARRLTEELKKERTTLKRALAELKGESNGANQR